MRNITYLLLVILILIGMDRSALTQEVSSTNTKTAETVLGCFNSGHNTIQTMRNCAGGWITPRALLYCFFGSSCVVLQDDTAGRQTFFASIGTLSALDVPLTLDTTNLPPFPTNSQITDCKHKSVDEEHFQQCVANEMAAAISPLVACGADRSDAGTCVASQIADAALIKTVACLREKTMSFDSAVSCSGSAGLSERVAEARKCISTSSGPINAGCLVPPGAAPVEVGLAQCLAHAGGQTAEAAQCLSVIAPGLSAIEQASSCLAAAAGRPLECSKNALTGTTAQLVTCLTSNNAPSDRALCALQTVSDYKSAAAVAACVAKGMAGQELAACETSNLGGDAGRFAACMSTAGGSASECLSSLNPKTAQAIKDFSCMTAASDATTALTCIAPHMPGDAPKIIGCLTGPRGAIGFCLLAGEPQYQGALKAYECLGNGTDAADLIANCSSGLIKDPKTREALTCVARAGSDEAQLSNCAAQAVLPSEIARYASCAATSTGATSFALCAAGPLMNEEFRIAAECAVESGGVPMSFAVCTAGRLTLRELTKCFTGKVGTDCFGPNNTVIVGVRNSLHDALQGPGKNNDIIKSMDLLTVSAGGSNSVVNNPGQILGGPDSVFHRSVSIGGGSTKVVVSPGIVVTPLVEGGKIAAAPVVFTVKVAQATPKAVRGVMHRLGFKHF